MTLLACDPGSTRSAYVVYDDRVVVASDRVPNESMLGVVDRYAADLPADAFVIEKVEGYGMPVGVEIFETVFWSGRFAERWLAQRRPGSLHRIGRKAVKRFLIGPMKRRDPRSRHSADKLIRDALIEMYGPGEHRAIGSFDHPGPLYRISKDQWAALAVAVAFEGCMKRERMTLFNWGQRMRTYRGYRQFDHCEQRSAATGVVVTVDGKPLTAAKSQKLHNHSPDGFNWGYGGSGPAQLALAIMLEHTGSLSEALAFYQTFKFDFVAGWGDTWEITSDQINAWMQRQRDRVSAEAMERRAIIGDYCRAKGEID